MILCRRRNNTITPRATSPASKFRSIGFPSMYGSEEVEGALDPSHSPTFLRPCNQKPDHRNPKGLGGLRFRIPIEQIEPQDSERKAKVAIRVKPSLRKSMFTPGGHM